MRYAFLPRPLALLTTVVLLAGLAPAVSAQVDYVRDITMPGDATYVLPTTQSPYEAGVTEFPYLLTSTTQYYTLNLSTGTFPAVAQLPPSIKMNQNSRLAWVGQNANGPQLLVITPQFTIVTYNADPSVQVVTDSPSLSVDYERVSSVAAQSLNGYVSMVADSQHYLVDRVTGVMTLTPLAGVDPATTLYQSFAPNGLLYVLDYGDSKVVAYNPTDFSTMALSFNLQPGVTTANAQFAIGNNGNIYLGDGLGGGSTYDASGDFLNTFTLPTGTVADPYNGQSFINTDSTGGVYVYDSATGLHEYQDLSVPEPSTWALLVLGGGALAWGLQRRRRLHWS